VTPGVLVAGVGNVLFGDDGFGVEVVHRLRQHPLPEGVMVADYGIRSLHLAFALLDAPSLLVLVDTMGRGGTPGSLYLIDPEHPDAASVASRPDPHGMDLGRVFELVAHMGGRLPRTRIVGCEPADLSHKLELSAPMLEAIPSAIDMIQQLIRSEGRTHEQVQS